MNKDPAPQALARILIIGALTIFVPAAWWAISMMTN
jgi:hypothetical protein